MDEAQVDDSEVALESPLQILTILKIVKYLNFLWVTLVLFLICLLDFGFVDFFVVVRGFCTLS